MRIVFERIAFYLRHRGTTIQLFNRNEVYLVFALPVPPVRHFGHSLLFAILLTKIFLQNHSAELRIVLLDDFQEQIEFSKFHHRPIGFHKTEPEHQETIINIELHTLTVGFCPHRTSFADERILRFERIQIPACVLSDDAVNLCLVGFPSGDELKNTVVNLIFPAKLSHQKFCSFFQKNA